jgi:hypothetical protein
MKYFSFGFEKKKNIQQKSLVFPFRREGKGKICLG